MIHYKESKKSLNDGTGDPWMSALFAGYINGMVDLLNYSGTVCFEDGVARSQVYDLIGKDLEDNPLTRNRPSVDLVTKLLLKNFPCEE